jgi:hypothetical protein
MSKIELINGYSMDADNLQYILRKKVTRNKKGVITEENEPQGYYPDVPSLLKDCALKINRELVANGEVETLQECIVKFEETNKRLDEIINQTRNAMKSSGETPCNDEEV